MDRADKVVLSLSQLDDRYIRGLVGEYKFILEFRLEKDGPGAAGIMIARSVRGISTSRSVNTEIYLEAGKYNVLLKITAKVMDRGFSVKASVKAYVEGSKLKLIQIAKKYNFAHMKNGVEDKDDRYFESLTADEDAKVKPEELAKGETDTNQSSNHPFTQVNPSTIDSKTPDDNSKPSANANLAAEVPVENPVTGEPKPIPEPEAKPDEKPETQKKDKSIENWNPIATVGLRIFTRKAKVVVSVVQTPAADISKAATNTTTSSTSTKVHPDKKPTILVSGQSARIGNVPPIGDPLPTTPIHGPNNAFSLGTVDTIINLNHVPTSQLRKPAKLNSPDSDTTSAALVIISHLEQQQKTQHQAVIATSTSHPLAMEDSTVKEGAEKVDAAKLTPGEELITPSPSSDRKEPHIKDAAKEAKTEAETKTTADVDIKAPSGTEKSKGSSSDSESSKTDTAIKTPGSGSGSESVDGATEESKHDAAAAAAAAAADIAKEKKV